MTSHMTVTHVTEKDIEGSETDNIIEHGNSMLALWRVYRLWGRLIVVCAQTIVCSI